MTTRYRVLSWRDIPQQIKVRGETGPPKAIELDRWYVEHADRVAMAIGQYGSEEYLDGFDWSPWIERDGTVAQVAADVVEELDAQWAATRERWKQTGDLGI